MNGSSASRYTTFCSSIFAMLMLSGCLMNDSAEVDAPTPPGGNTGNAMPEISGAPPRMIKVGVAYAFTPQASDADADTLTFSVANKPAWLDFSTSSGALTGMPLLGSEGTYSDIEITVSDGSLAASLAPFSITVEPVTAPNMPPEITGTPAIAVTVGDNYSFAPSVSDPDGDALTFTVQNLPGWASFDNQTGTLSGTPAAGDEGDFQGIAISVSDGIASASLPAFTVTVNPANVMPTISGTPPTTVLVGNAYSFTPSATDPNGDTLTFAIDNLPTWASFDQSNGTLAGTPQANDVGPWNGIEISVTDGVFSAALPVFSITVTAANSAPQISGTPANSVNEGQAYSFTPTASDADGDNLVFTIQNPPSWAQFDSTTGALSGTPQAGDAGSYAGIVISVSDGSQTVSLPSFAITVSQVAMGSATLSWTPPTQNADGSPLTNIAGYRVYYGTSPGVYPNMEPVNNAGVSTFVVNSLTPGTWYFVTTTVNSNGIESAFSNMASKTIN